MHGVPGRPQAQAVGLCGGPCAPLAGWAFERPSGWVSRASSYPAKTRTVVSLSKAAADWLWTFRRSQDAS